MPRLPRITPILLVALCAVVGYLLVTMPGEMFDQYQRAAERGPLWGAGYLAIVGLGLALLLGSIGWILWNLWRNTRATRKRKQRDRKSAREMSAGEKRSAIDEHLQEAREIAAGAEQDPQVQAVIEENLSELETRLEEQTLRIVAFGTISSGKSSILNALVGRDVFATDVRGGTTLTSHDLPWPGRDQIMLVDTPGLGEVEGGEHTRLARTAAREADLVLLVLDGPVKDFEHRTLKALAEMDKRILVCLNKGDWYAPEDLEKLLAQIRKQVAPDVPKQDVLAVQARPAERVRVRVLPDGTEQEETQEAPADIEPLAKRMIEVTKKEGKELLLANLLLQSRGLVSGAREQVQAMLDAQARKTIDRYTWRAGGAAAISPLPAVDIAAGLGVAGVMVVELARVYRQPIDFEGAKEIVETLLRNLAASLGVQAVTPFAASLLASSLKAVPGIGTVGGGVLQGLSQALITRWVGRVMMVYFRNHMNAPGGSLSDLARREWDQLTSRSELVNLARTGLKRLGRES
ncbi:MAG: YcjF family protein [Phycisphaeraceae bacterium]